MTAEQGHQLADIVWIDPERMSGAACFKGTRVPVQTLIDHIEGNSTLEDFLQGFPSVSQEQAAKFMEFADANLLVEEDDLSPETEAAIEEGLEDFRQGRSISLEEFERTHDL